MSSPWNDRNPAGRQFPLDKIFPFFTEGLRHRRAGPDRHPSELSDEELCKHYDVQGIQYFLTMSFGALRSSEPLHIYPSDIEFDWQHGNGAIVRLYHPSKGPAPEGGQRWKNREAYLASEYGLVPRNLLSGHRQAGWKGMLFEDGQSTQVYWVDPEIGRLFWRLHQVYMRFVRPKTGLHPYYFSSLSPKAYGEPWTLDATQDLFGRALRKIGLEPCKAKGLTRHGLRHGVCHWMILNNVQPEARRLVLHQQSMESQKHYGNLEPSEVALLLRQANRKRGLG